MAKPVATVSETPAKPAAAAVASAVHADAAVAATERWMGESELGAVRLGASREEIAGPCGRTAAPEAYTDA